MRSSPLAANACCARRLSRFTVYLCCKFLYDQENPLFDMDAPLDQCPSISDSLRIYVFRSAIATLHAPSDLSGIDEMHCEDIRATPSWCDNEARYDCVLIEKDPNDVSSKGLHVAQVERFFHSCIKGKYIHALLSVGQ